MELSQIRKVHMVGIKGTGMSSLALALARIGITITGSDSAKDSFLLLDEANFHKAHIKIFSDFHADNVPPDANAVVVSTSHHHSRNSEVEKAHELGIPVFTYPQMLGILTRSMPTYAVCGSHGKTTTTNLLAWTLQSAGKPTLAIAGPTSQQVTDGLSKRPDLFILEADEYENKLQHYSPIGVILTNVERDHPDYFKTDQEYENVFIDFIKRIPPNGWLIYCAEDSGARRIAKHAICKTYVYTANSEFPTHLLGRHNQLNASAIVIAARLLGVSDSDIRTAFDQFEGSHRRLQKVSDNPLIYDDYGHHPTEIKATLRALREHYPDKTIWTVFHPHTFTRTKEFLKDFGMAFTDSDHTIVLEIYASAREVQGTVHSRDVVAELQKNKSDAMYFETFQETANFLNTKLDDSSLLLTIGAGDVWRIHAMISRER